MQFRSTFGMTISPVLKVVAVRPWWIDSWPSAAFIPTAWRAVCFLWSCALPWATCRNRLGPIGRVSGWLPSCNGNRFGRFGQISVQPCNFHCILWNECFWVWGETLIGAGVSSSSWPDGWLLERAGSCASREGDFSVETDRTIVGQVVLQKSLEKVALAFRIEHSCWHLRNSAKVNARCGKRATILTWGCGSSRLQNLIKPHCCGMPQPAWTGNLLQRLACTAALVILSLGLALRCPANAA